MDAELLRRNDVCHVVRDYLHHFANPVRLRIMCELRLGERSVSELVDAVGARQSSVSQALNHLKLAGLVEFTRVGASNRYRISDALAQEMMEFLYTLAEKLMLRKQAGFQPPPDDECVCADAQPSATA